MENLNNGITPIPVLVEASMVNNIISNNINTNKFNYNKFTLNNNLIITNNLYKLSNYIIYLFNALIKLVIMLLTNKYCEYTKYLLFVIILIILLCIRYYKVSKKRYNKIMYNI